MQNGRRAERNGIEANPMAMTTLTTVSYIHEADLVCMKLEGAGIMTFLPDQGLSTMQPLLSGAIGGIRIQVEEDDLARAREVLSMEPPPAEQGLFRCPACDSDDVKYEQLSRRFAFLSLLLIGIPLLWFKEQCVCRRCGRKWKAAKG